MLLELGFGIVSAGFVGTIFYARKLQEQHRRDVVLLDLSLQLSSTIKRKQLLEVIMTTTARSLRAEGSSIILLDPDSGELYFEVATGENHKQVKEIRLQPGEGIAGWVALHGQSLLIPNTEKDERWSSRVAKRSAIATRNMICVPVQSNGALLGVLQVINKKGKSPFNKLDLAMLESMSAPVAMAIENMLLYEALEHNMNSLQQTTAAKEKMESEMRIAREIQESFLPGNQYKMHSCQLNATLMPAREVGGDFYHFFPLDDEHVLLCLGDVSDKGMPAALFMSAVMIWIKAKSTEFASPEQIITAINEELSTDYSTMFATIFLAIMNTKTGQFVYCDAGHCPPLLLRNGSVTTLNSQKGLPIGVLVEAPYVAQSIQLQADDRIIMYTDGITEAENEYGQWYGMERLQHYLTKQQYCSTEEQVKYIVNDVQSFVATYPQCDDIAIMCIDYRDSMNYLN
ncbi:PP2C family protein-serine/threonine phosphatase [Paenibacillus endoradicis]|uniref:PP2C family protein-serine/threonine phosphatase n=1 Tax=Paenibacillus endoradicis TaxID=2972487 RepID=UPI002158D44A|nr:GAF domain-containing SpoIIE family protein phosphatase [Paenibacillus endoradicis]MCR8657455.1 SpoIIE family protein phosphatase [Paenibacillus endoradicis]